jgi:thioredoxin-related protein
MYSSFKSSIFLSLLLFTLPSVFAQKSLPDFYGGTFAGMASKAKATSKPFMVYFTAEECRACERMESGTLVDNASVAFLNEHFLIKDLDGRSFMGEGMDIAEKFGVNVFPTLMFFSPDGKPLHKIVGYVNPEHFLANLEQEYENSANIKSGFSDISYLSHVDNSKPILSKAMKATNSYKSSYFEEETTENDYASLSKVYNLSALPNASYGIQLGIFSSKKQLDEALDGYQQRLADVYVTVETEVNGKHCYKLLVGLFESQEMAMIKQQQLENDLIASGFVLNYKELRNTNASSNDENDYFQMAEPN